MMQNDDVNFLTTCLDDEREDNQNNNCDDRNNINKGMLTVSLIFIFFMMVQVWGRLFEMNSFEKSS